MAIRCKNVLDDLKSYKDFTFNTIFCDPPYNLGSKWYIDIDGRPKIKQAQEFMNKWSAFDDKDWYSFFKQANRVLKHGGYCIMFSQERQSFPIQYYAIKNGFEICQGLFWYYICLSDDTEILTKDGWKNIDELSIDDYVVEFNLESKKVDFKKPKQKIVEEYDGEMVYISNKNTEQLLTKAHKCVILNTEDEQNEKLEFERAGNLVGKESWYPTFRNEKEIWKIFEGGNLQRMWTRVSFRWKTTKSTILYKVLPFSFFKQTKKRETNEKTWWANKSNLCNLWDRIFKMEKRYKKRTIKFLFKKMLWFTSKIKENKTAKRIEKQRKKTNERRKNKKIIKSCSWFKASLVERWCNIFSEKGKLCWSEICEMSEKVFINVKKRRLCYGTSFNSCTTFETMFEKNGSCSSYRSQHKKQQIRKSNTFQEQSRSQTLRKRTLYKTSLAIPEIVNYKGRVWCVETSTGAFIARRKGKIFITGNSNFPKATDVSKMIDKRLGKKREVIGKDPNYHSEGKRTGKHQYKLKEESNGQVYKSEGGVITASASDLAKQFDGYKYGKASLKQVVESILVFRKPTKNKSVLDDIFAWSEGDQEISPSVINIDEGRVPIKEDDWKGVIKKRKSFKNNEGNLIYKGNSFSKSNSKDRSPDEKLKDMEKGRYPAQLFTDEKCSKVINEQSGILKSGSILKKHKFKENQSFAMSGKNYERQPRKDWIGNTGGASRILHTCEYEQKEIDLLHYCPKVSSSERSAGLEDFEEKERSNLNKMIGCPDETMLTGSGNLRNNKMKNNHPTLKPIKLCKHIMTLFKLPKEVNQKVYIPFAGVYSEFIGTMKAGISNRQIYGCEINSEYIEIGKARLKYWSKKKISKKGA